MRRHPRVGILVALLTLILAGFWVTPASAQATRTWVSGVGDDVNPCSRTAPCKTFAGAISKTAAGGEINCLDPGGFGAVTITKSLTIACPYTEGGLLAGGNGILVNLPAATDVVYIRGLDIFGVNPPSSGIRFIGQGTLMVEDSVIRRFAATNTFGIAFFPNAAARLFVHNVTVTDNGLGGQGGGIDVEPSGAGTAQVTLQDVRVVNNANVGFRIVTTAGNGAAGVNALLDRVTASRNAGEGIQAVAGAGAPPAVLMLVNSNAAGNTGAGVTANGVGATMRVGNTNITGNATGVLASNSSSIRTYGNNRNDGNTADGAFTLPIIPQE